MRNKTIILLLSLLLIGCSTNEKISSSSSSYYSVSESQSSTLSVSSSVSSSQTSSLISNTSSSSAINLKNIKEINDLALGLSEGEIGQEVSFEGYYAKEITDNQDKLMLFVDETGYLYVRVKGGFQGNNEFLKNRYKKCLYKVNGRIQKYNGNLEIVYNSLVNITSTPEEFDYSSISENKDSLIEVYEEVSKVVLNKKDTGVGKIVSFKGTIVSTDRSDSNTKAVVYDGHKTITLIDDKKICDNGDIGKTYKFTGSISILKSSPGIWLLDKTYIDNDLNNLDFSSAKEVKPSYFKQWYYVGDHIKKPTYEDYSILYKVTGFVTDNADYTAKYNLGLVDEENGSLSDNNLNGTYSIKGVFLMNNHNMDMKDLSYSVFYEPYINASKISIYVTLHQFNTNDHGWKVFPLDFTLQIIE